MTSQRAVRRMVRRLAECEARTLRAQWAYRHDQRLVRRAAATAAGVPCVHAGLRRRVLARLIDRPADTILGLGFHQATCAMRDGRVEKIVHAMPCADRATAEAACRELGARDARLASLLGPFWLGAEYGVITTRFLGVTIVAYQARVPAARFRSVEQLRADGDPAVLADLARTVSRTLRQTGWAPDIVGRNNLAVGADGRLPVIVDNLPVARHALGVRHGPDTTFGVALARRLRDLRTPAAGRPDRRSALPREELVELGDEAVA